jgi:uncharacterized membrane protein YoaK (UPF0700 family)
MWAALVKDEKHGPLPGLLVGLTLLTGLVDAVSILSLGRVFVANMTGNVVFVGFAIGGAPGFALAASLAALAGFLLGAFAGGMAILGPARHRATVLRNAVGCELVLVSSALALGLALPTPFRGAGRDALAALLAVAMGLQNAVVRRLAVPDLTTTVLTMTLTGIAADVHGSGHGPVLTRRVLAVAAMLAGAIAGALLVIEVSAVASLAAAVGVLALVLIGAALTVQRRPTWT